jgi:hypothetical protein
LAQGQKEKMKSAPPLYGRFLALVFAAAITVVLAFPAYAQTKCRAFPKVTFWGELTHDSVSRHVDDKLAGDWGRYLKQLKRHQAALSRIHKRGAGAVIKRKDRKIKLAGKQLAKYLDYSKKRISVVSCLAKTKSAAGLADFSTAAGTPDDLTPKGKTKASAPGKEAMGRAYITLPKKLLAKLRKKAVRQSLKDARKISVSEIIVEILEREMKKRDR